MRSLWDKWWQSFRQPSRPDHTGRPGNFCLLISLDSSLPQFTVLLNRYRWKMEMFKHFSNNLGTTAHLARLRASLRLRKKMCTYHNDQHEKLLRSGRSKATYRPNWPRQNVDRFAFLFKNHKISLGLHATPVPNLRIFFGSMKYSANFDKSFFGILGTSVGRMFRLTRSNFEPNSFYSKFLCLT